MSESPNTALQRTRVRPEGGRSPLSFEPLGDRLGTSAAAVGLALGLTACASAQPVPTGYEGRLLLHSEVHPTLSVGVRRITVRFSVENTSGSQISACVGDPWGVNVILPSGRDVGPKELVDHPSCVTPFRLNPGESFEWTKEGTLGQLKKGMARVSSWAKIVDPSSCDQKYGCNAFSLTTPVKTVALE